MTDTPVKRAVIVALSLLAIAGWLVGGIEWPSIGTEFWPVFLMAVGVVAQIVWATICAVVSWVCDG